MRYAFNPVLLHCSPVRAGSETAGGLCVQGTTRAEPAERGSRQARRHGHRVISDCARGWRASCAVPAALQRAHPAALPHACRLRPQEVPPSTKHGIVSSFPCLCAGCATLPCAVAWCRGRADTLTISSSGTHTVQLAGPRPPNARCPPSWSTATPPRSLCARARHDVRPCALTEPPRAWPLSIWAEHPLSGAPRLVGSWQACGPCLVLLAGWRLVSEQQARV